MHTFHTSQLFLKAFLFLLQINLMIGEGGFRVEIGTLLSHWYGTKLYRAGIRMTRKGKTKVLPICSLIDLSENTGFNISLKG